MTAVAALAGCTGGSNEAAPIPTIELTTTTVLATTTTTEPTTTTEDPNLALVEAAYRGHLAYEDKHRLRIDEDALSEFTAEPLLGRIVERLMFYESEGIDIGSDQYYIHILSIEIDEATAIVTSCNLDGVSLVYPDGSTYVPADEVRYLRVTELALMDVGWRVIDTGFGEGEKAECAV